MFLMIKNPEINMKAEIGNILRGTGISRQFAGHYIHSQTITNSRKGDFS
jgi:hypothetical protein